MPEQASKNEGEPESQTDRVKWLRDRGVQIEFAANDPEGDKASQKGESNERTITIVKIPHDIKEAYQEIQVKVSATPQHTDQLINLLKPNFAAESVSVDDSKLNEATKGLLSSSEQAATLSSVNPKNALLKMLEGQGHVESFKLTTPCQDNSFTAVSIYLDEAGQLKGLANNTRAAAIAGYCGFKDVKIAGDVFIGRYSQDPSKGLLSVGCFTTPELDSSSPWMKQAERANYMRGVEQGLVTMDGGGEMPGSSDEPGKFAWSQTEDTVDVCLHLPKGSGATAKKGLDISIERDTLRVETKTDDHAVLLDIKLFAKIRPDDSTWTISGDDLEFSLEKVEEEVWKELGKEAVNL